MLSILALATAAPPARELTAWDCNNPTSIRVFDSETMCSQQSPPAMQPNGQAAIIAQVVNRHTTEGFRCQARRTTTSHVCGAFSYEKALPELTETIQLRLSIADCRTLVYTGNFRDSSNGVVSEKLGGGMGAWHFVRTVRGLE